LPHSFDHGKIDAWARAALQPTTPDLFSTASNQDVLTTTAPEKDTPRHILPNDLSNAIKRLTDQENSQKRRVEEGYAPMSIGKLNAVRAPFKAGFKPSQIARQFRISQSDVRKALSGGDASERTSKRD
jgi:hypothetical protein